MSGSISQREKSVSRSPLLSIVRYPVTPGGMEDDGCVLRVEVQGLQTSPPSFDLVCLALRIYICIYIIKETDVSSAGMISVGHLRRLLDDSREMGKKA